MQKITVVSSCYGRYDEIVAPVPQDVACDWVMVADEQYHCPPWRVVHKPRPGLPPRLAAKMPKCRPDLYAPDAQVLIWIDASIQITAPDFVRWVTSFLDHGPLAQCPHPYWDTVAEEVEVLMRLQNNQKLPLYEQLDSYYQMGFADEHGLWASTIMVMSPAVPAALGDAWLREQVRWTTRDQVSWVPLLAHHGLWPVPLTGSLYTNDRFRIRPHRRGGLKKLEGGAWEPVG